MFGIEDTRGHFVQSNRFFRKLFASAKGTVLKTEEMKQGLMLTWRSTWILSESDKDDVDLLHHLILDLVKGVYLLRNRILMFLFSLAPRYPLSRFRARCRSSSDCSHIFGAGLWMAAFFPGVRNRSRRSVDGQSAFDGEVGWTRTGFTGYRFDFLEKWRNNTGLESLGSVCAERKIGAHSRHPRCGTDSRRGRSTVFPLYVAQSKLINALLTLLG